MSSFVHLHTHSQYSLLDGALSLPDLFRGLQEKGMDSVALTDHGNMYGAIPFYTQAKKAGIHPILGCEVYMARESHKDKGPQENSPYHLVLLAEDQEGYENLMKLVTLASTEGFYYKPRIDKDLLYQHRRGLITLTACLQGEIPRLLLEGQEDRARKSLKEYKQIMGQDHLFVELQNHGLEEEEQVNPRLIELAREEGLQLVATNDVHYLQEEDHEFHDVLLCIQTKQALADEDRMRFPNSSFHLRSPEEMAIAFEGLPQALTSTVEIARRCAVNLSFDHFRLPDFPLPKGEDAHSTLERLAREGLKQLPQVTSTIEERLSYELKVIKEMGFSSYFLIVHDFIVFAQEQNITVGPGRGSVAGSLIAYLLGITGINPLEYGLIFERFLNPERVTMPDIDIDFCFERRDEVIQYVAEKYGQDRVAHIVTFGTMAARGALRDVGRVLGMPYGDVDAIAKEVPETLGITLEEALERSPALARRYEEEPQSRRLLDLARAVEGAPRHASTHAAGVVITPDALTCYTPLQKTKGEITTQYEMKSLEKIGLLKVDFLALRTLTVIDYALGYVEAKTGKRLNMKEIPLDDGKTYALLQTGKTSGVFQMESPLYQRLNKEYQPETFEDIIAIIALGRPGPMGSDRLGDFIHCRHGRKEVCYPHSILEPILKETYGVILYQEQVMEIACTLGGLSMGEADILRRAMGKKEGDLFEKYRQQFLDHAHTQGVSREKGQEIFNLMEYFGGYGFNKSHSAAYALIAYFTAYLKAHYPLEFMAALLNSVMGDTDKVAKYSEECRQMDIEVLAPDVNQSGLDFTLSQGSIRFGLVAIKNVGRGAIESILTAREEKPFNSLLDFCQRVDGKKLHLRALESLIKAGALDSLGLRRSQLLAIMETTYHRGQSHQKARAHGQMSLLDLMEGGEEYTRDVDVPDLQELPQKERLQMEREMLGFYISGHPLDPFGDLLRVRGTLELSSLPEQEDGQEVTLGGVIAQCTIHRTRQGQEMAFVTLEDWYDLVDVIVFPDLFGEHSGILLQGEPVLIRGRVDQQEENTTKVVAQEMESLQPPFVLEVPLMALQDGALQTIKEILESVQGNSPILLRIFEGEESVWVALGKKFLGPGDREGQKECKEKVQKILKCH